MVASPTRLLIGLAALIVVSNASPDVHEIVPESSDTHPQPKMVHVVLHHRPRSAASHKKLTDWIQQAHDREVHPVILIETDAPVQKLTATELLQGADLVEYYGKIKVGPMNKKEADKNTFTVVCDTGSGIAWVPGKSCSDSACTGHHQIQDMEGIQLSDGAVDIRYGTGSMTGQRAKGDLTVSGVTVKNQDMLLSTSENGAVFLDGRFDGVVGFGRPKLAQVLVQDTNSNEHPMPFYMNAIDQNLLQKNEFSFYIPKKKGKAGAMVLGGVNRNLDKGGKINMHKVKSKSYWMFDIQALQIGSKRIETDDKENEGKGSLRAIADSGTSLLVVPEPWFTQIKADVQCKDDCSNMHELKDFSLIAKNTEGKEVTYTLKPDDYVMQRDGNCKTGIAPMNLQLPTSHKVAIAGDTYLRKFVSVYNPKENLVGFVEADHDKAAEHMDALQKKESEL